MVPHSYSHHSWLKINENAHIQRDLKRQRESDIQKSFIDDADKGRSTAKEEK